MDIDGGGKLHPIMGAQELETYPPVSHPKHARDHVISSSILLGFAGHNCADSSDAPRAAKKDHAGVLVFRFPGCAEQRDEELAVNVQEGCVSRPRRGRDALFPWFGH